MTITRKKDCNIKNNFVKLIQNEQENHMDKDTKVRKNC